MITDGIREFMGCAWPNCSPVPTPPVALELLAALSRMISRLGSWYVFGAEAVTCP